MTLGENDGGTFGEIHEGKELNAVAPDQGRGSTSSLEMGFCFLLGDLAGAAGCLSCLRKSISSQYVDAEPVREK